MHTTSILPALHGGDSTAPRAASGGRSTLARAGLAIWRALEASGQARAMREMRALRGQWEISDEAFLRQLQDGSAFGTPASNDPR